MNEGEISLTSKMNLLNGLGWAFVDLEKYQEAIDFFNEQLLIAQNYSEIWQEANALNGLGFTYTEIGQYQKAIHYSEQALAIHRQIGDHREEAYALGDIGNAYFFLGNNQKALEYLGLCLLIQREINNRWGEGITLSSIAQVMHRESRNELAIAFLKSSVKVRESIRGDILGLETELQKSFIDTISDDYRFLADLLLQQNRILEAQRVLDLLKVQELDESLRSVDGNSDTETGVGFWQVEEGLLSLYEQVMAESAEWTALRSQDYDSLSPEQQQRLTELRQRYETVQSQFVAFLDRPEVQELLDQIADETDRQNVDTLTDF